MRHLTKSLDKVASELEKRGLTKLAEEVDIVSNTLERAAAADEAFIFPPTGTKVKDEKGHFPIPDANHARNALARANQYSSAPSWYDGTLTELKKEVADTVKARYPMIEVTEESYL